VLGYWVAVAGAITLLVELITGESQVVLQVVALVLAVAEDFLHQLLVSMVAMVAMVFQVEQEATLVLAVRKPILVVTAVRV